MGIGDLQRDLKPPSSAHSSAAGLQPQDESITMRVAERAGTPEHGEVGPLAQHKSAQKRAQQSRRRQARNSHLKSRMRTLIKRFRSAVEAGGADAAEKFREAEGAIRRAASSGVIPRRRASRSVGRLAKHLNAPSL